jgi:RNA ligase partner protein
MERFVLDTSVFTNPESYSQFSPEPEEAVRLFLALARRTGAEFYMPVSVYEELRHVRAVDAIAPQFELAVRIRSPRKHELQIPANVLYEFIDEVRHRIDRGLRIAEEYTRRGREALTAEDAGLMITRLRERYREALRRGIIDSREDADCLLLAYELDARLVSADEGLRTWADKVGVKLVLPQNLRSILDALIEGQPAA